MLYFVHKTEYHFKLSIFYYTYTLYPLYIKDINSQKKNWKTKKFYSPIFVKWEKNKMKYYVKKKKDSFPLSSLCFVQLPILYLSVKIWHPE